jgi:hypothetical protein
VRTANVLGLSGAYEAFLYEESLTAYNTSHPRSFIVQSAAEGKAVVVTLAWTDPAGMSDCGSDWSTSECLIHDVSFRPLAGFFVSYVRSIVQESRLMATRSSHIKKITADDKYKFYYLYYKK